MKVHAKARSREGSKPDSCLLRAFAPSRLRVTTELLPQCDGLACKLTHAESSSTQLLSAAVHHGYLIHFARRGSLIAPKLWKLPLKPPGVTCGQNGEYPRACGHSMARQHGERRSKALPADDRGALRQSGAKSGAAGVRKPSQCTASCTGSNKKALKNTENQCF